MESAVNWGGPVWRDAAREAEAYLGDLRGLTALEIGYRHGDVSRWFASKGASVTGIEIDSNFCPVIDNCTFLHYSGDLDEIDGQFDVVFCKSVLIMTGPKFIEKIPRKMKSNGRFVCIENGMGGMFSQAARLLRHPLRKSRFDFFESRHIELIGDTFHLDRWRYYPFPPVYLVCARAK
jgi:SAM-dependent methyltransferase